MANLSPIGRRGALGLAGAAAVAGKAGAQAPAEVKIAMLVPLSGPWARSGLLEQMGARMAIDEVNAAGGIKALGGAKLKLMEYDAGDSPEKAKDAAQRMLAQEPDLAGGFGCWHSGFTLAATEVTERAQLPWLTLSYSDLITGRGFKNVFQTSPTAASQAVELLPVVMELATSSTGKRPTKVALIGCNNPAVAAFLKPMRDTGFAEQKLTLVADEIFTAPLADATTIVQKVRSGKPDFVIAALDNVGDDKLLLEKLAEFGLGSKKLPVIGNGGHWLVPELLKLTAPENLEGMLIGLANWPNKTLSGLEKRFMDRTKEPWFGHDSIFPYAHVMILKEAIERAASADRHKVAAALRAIDITDGPALLFPDGRLAFDEKGRRKGAKISIVQYQNSKPVLVYPEAMASAKPVWPKVA
ncbi:MAG: branched-chain amino acid ABC transporter substrate-binding protein [Acetobacteraceae bacterium]|nr:branched-chain amino acid ABC transporter substrate-binding protein [Acetobacteraceae bacterium]